MTAWFIPVPGTRYIIAHLPGVNAALYPWARLIVRRAQAAAPVRTGRLRSRIRIVPRTVGLDVVSDATDEKGFLYSAVQERRRPYLRPAIRR